MRSFAKSIYQSDEHFYATLPVAQDIHLIESFDINTLLVLRVICQFGRVSTADLVNNLRLHGLVVNSAIATCMAQGIVELVNGRYQVSWNWYRVVARFLARQNLLNS